MSGTSTVYDIKVRYAMDGNASKGVKALANDTDKAAKNAMSLKGALAAIGGIALLKGAKSALIDFNSEIDQMKIGLTAVMQMQLKMPFEKAKDEAQKLFNVFQELAKKSPATTKDFMEMGNAIAPVVAMMGGGPDKIAKLAQGGVLASQAFGERADVVALDIKQMLSGTVSSKDRVAQQLIASKGMDSTKFNAKSGKERATLTESMLQDPALLKAADQMGESFAGQSSTLRDQLEMTLGQVGLPLMQALTSEFKKINTWIEKHPKLIKEWVTSFGNGIKDAFEFLKGVAGFFIDNKDLIFSLAKALLIFKGAQLAQNVFKRFTDGVGGLADTMKKGLGGLGGGMGGFLEGGIGGVAKKFGNMIPVLGTVIGGLGLLGDVATTAAQAITGQREEEKKAKENLISLWEAVEDVPTMISQAKGLTAGIKKAPEGELKQRMTTELEGIEKKLYNPQKMGLALRKLNEESVKMGGKDLSKYSQQDLTTAKLQHHLPNVFAGAGTDTKKMDDLFATLKLLEKQFGRGHDIQMEILKHAFPDQFGMPTPEEAPKVTGDWSKGDKPEVNVTIQRVEVASEDPDRFVFGLVQIADRALKHSTQSQHTTPGGF